MENRREAENQVNPYIERIFGVWFKNILLLALLLPSIFLLIFGLVNSWIGKDFGLQLLFLLLGIYIGKWFENGK